MVVEAKDTDVMFESQMGTVLCESQMVVVVCLAVGVEEDLVWQECKGEDRWASCRWEVIAQVRDGRWLWKGQVARRWLCK